MPVSYYVIGAVTQIILTTGIRFAYRYINLMRKHREQMADHQQRNVMVIGAGAAGQMILKELKNTEEIKLKPCCVKRRYHCFRTKVSHRRDLICDPDRIRTDAQRDPEYLQRDKL